ncbi:hypothetical protein C8R44DRAFT_863424 [Mycena epipterygia]|nr:hypothetical protein C8R44DRAFT_863424 [Mycena epipterygia]
MATWNPSPGVAYLDKIPTEVWLRCWMHCPKRHLRRLGLVCHYFHNLCLPFLFQHQTFFPPPPEDVDRDNWIETTQALHRSTLRLAKLAASPHVSSVRTWYFRGSSGMLDLAETHPYIVNIHLVQDTYLKAVHIFHSTLSHYQKLQSLRLDDFFIGTQFRETLSSLTQLEDLNLSNCTVACPTGRLLPLHKLNVTGRRARTADLMGDPLQLVVPDALITLRFDGSLVGVCVLYALADLTLAHLVELTIELTPPIAEIFFTSFVNSACPRLERLHIPHVSRAAVIPTRIPPTAVPLLQSFKGPLSLLRLFIPDRPVTFIRVSSPSTASTPEILSALSDIAQSSATLSVLELHPQIAGSPEILAALTELLPDLRQLSLELKEPSRLWPPLVVGAPTTQSVSSGSEWEEGVDDRTVELSDDGSLDSMASDVSAVPSDDEEASGLPDEPEPGYMYRRSGKSYPPPRDAAHEGDPEDPELFPGVVEGMCAGRIALPQHLEMLRFRQPGGSWGGSTGFTMTEEHRTLLCLGALRPGLQQIGFAKNAKTMWTRRGNVWTQRVSGNKVIAL